VKSDRRQSERADNVIIFRRPPRPVRRDDAAESDGNRRGRVRKPALWAGKLATSTGTHDCLVTNFTPSGAAMELTEPVTVDEPVTLTLDLLGAFVGTVKWSGHRCIGMDITERRFTTIASRTFLPGQLRLP
jgi:hypothetical protein